MPGGLLDERHEISKRLAAEAVRPAKLLRLSGATESVSYSDTKLLVTALMAAVARLRPDVLANAVDPGWVPTRMGGPDAAEDLDLAHVTQAWLVTSQDARALSSGGYWHHGRVEQTHPAVHDEVFQDALLAALAEHTGTHLLDG